MRTVLRTPDRTPVRPARYAPKGSRPVLTGQVTHLWNHAFLPQTLDPVSCVRCNLPRGNGRHS